MLSAHLTFRAFVTDERHTPFPLSIKKLRDNLDTGDKRFP
jgi:hypothetical protein